MKLILACVDFSPVTDLVLNMAAELACATKAQLAIAYVAVRPVPVIDGVWAATLGNIELLSEQERLIQERLDHACARLRQEYGLEATTIVTEGMQAAAPLLYQAERLDPDLIIVGSHGYGVLGRLLLGSTSQGVVRKGRWPVIVVPTPKAAKADSAAEAAEPAGAGDSTPAPCGGCGDGGQPGRCNGTEGSRCRHETRLAPVRSRP